jgi:hypothetical protein
MQRMYQAQTKESGARKRGPERIAASVLDEALLGEEYLLHPWRIHPRHLKNSTRHQQSPDAKLVDGRHFGMV